MADNYTFKNASGTTLTRRSTDTAGVHTNHVIVTAGTGATDLGKAEDAAHASGDTGVAILAVRRDAAAVGSGTDGDYSTVNVDALGKVWVSGTYAEDAVAGSGDQGHPALAVRRDTRAASAADGDYNTLNLNAQGELYVQASQKRALFTAVPTTAAGAYAAGDVVGTLMTITSAVRFSGGSGVIENIVVNDKENVISNLDIVFFSASVSVGSDNAAYSLADGDWDKIITFENIDNVCSSALNRVLKYTPPAGIPFVAVGSADIYAVLVCRTGFTLASATDLKLALTIRQD